MRRRRIACALVFFATFLANDVEGFIASLIWQENGCNYNSPSTSKCLARSTVEGIDVIPESILSDETCRQIDEWIQKRAEARWIGDYRTADAFRDRLSQTDLLPPGVALQIEDVPRSAGGGSRWSLICNISNHIVAPPVGPSVLQIAHSALGLAVSASRTRQDFSMERTRLANLAIQRLQAWAIVQERIRKDGLSFFKCADSNSEDTSYWWAVEQELRGRKAADAAFWFAMAGVSTQQLYDLLIQVGVKELQRFGHRPSCRAKDIWAVIDRFAAAGVSPTENAIRVVSAILSDKQEHDVSIDKVVARWDLHSDSCALLVWKFSTRQPKPRDFLTMPRIEPPRAKPFASTCNWTDVFADPELPLIIDIGCGMGVSLLGAASMAIRDEKRHPWELCNCLGVDLSPLAIGYAQGVSKRWGLNESLHFLVDSAEHALEMVESSYPGNVSQVLIQFPTPYRLQAGSSAQEYQGNTQLPKDKENGFMVSKALLRSVASLLQNSRGTLLLQSNCEDVALYMYDTAILDAGMEGIQSEDPRLEMPRTTTQRTVTWLAQQVCPSNRATGPIWWNSAILPKICQTETEIACGLNGTPVHRCLLYVP